GQRRDRAFEALLHVRAHRFAALAQLCHHLVAPLLQGVTHLVDVGRELFHGLARRWRQHLHHLVPPLGPPLLGGPLPLADLSRQGLPPCRWFLACHVRCLLRNKV